jgi:hypothetical protein
MRKEPNVHPAPNKAEAETEKTSATEIRVLLAQKGWSQEIRLGQESWWKRWPNARDCNLNTNKEGVTTSIDIWEAPCAENPGQAVYAIHLRAEKPDGIWVDLSVYSLNGETLKKSLTTQCQQLLASWETMCDTCKKPEPSLP